MLNQFIKKLNATDGKKVHFCKGMGKKNKGTAAFKKHSEVAFQKEDKLQNCVICSIKSLVSHI